MGSTQYKMKLSETSTAARPFEYSLLSGELLESYAYDPLGRRASTTSGGTTIRHVYDGAHCVADLDSSGALLRSYIWGPGIDNLLAVTCHSGSSATTYYAITDIQGTVHGFADAGGNLVESYAYDAWGNVLSVRDASGLPIQNLKSPIGNRYLFQGREYSHVTGLYNFRLRWYDPATGRWLSKDPIGISGGLNLYAFCGDDPVNYVDLSGCGRLTILKRTVKNGWNAISRKQAIKRLERHETVTVVGKGSRQPAKRLAEEGTRKKIKRHDAHHPELGEYDHFQPKNGGGAHVNVPGANLGIVLLGDNFLGNTADFFNPISDVQEGFDISEDILNGINQFISDEVDSFLDGAFDINDNGVLLLELQH